ncbi:MAG: FKBP-type peptidyl-prolyl cis-trans isomerase [Bacteroidota bacterium]
MMKKIILPLAAFGMLITACTSKYPGYSESDNGLFYKIVTEGDQKQKPELGDILTFAMIYKTDKDSVLYDTKSLGGTLQIKVEDPIYKGDINEAFKLMYVGDSGVFIVNADSFFMKNVGLEKIPPFIKPGSNLYFHIKVISMQTKESFEKEQREFLQKQQAELEKQKSKEWDDLVVYIKKNNVKAVPTASGIYITHLKKGKGPTPKKGQVVEINYSGFYLDNIMFDTSDKEMAKKYNLYNPKAQYAPFKFVLGQSEAINGVDEAVRNMSVGGKAKVIIPSSQAYGEKGVPGKIKPCATLLFEIELLSVK